MNSIQNETNFRFIRKQAWLRLVSRFLQDVVRISLSCKFMKLVLFVQMGLKLPRNNKITAKKVQQKRVTSKMKEWLLDG